MLRFDFWLVADGAEFRDGKINVRGGALTRFYVPAFPTQAAPVVVVGRILVDRDDQGSSHPARFEMRDRTTGGILEALEGDLFIDDPEVPPQEGEDWGEVFIVEFKNLIFHAPGPYEFIMIVDGERLATYPVVVVEAPTTPSDAPGAAS